MTAVERALRVLEPLMPDQVRAWRRSLDLSDPELKTLLEKEILTTAHRTLGDFRSKPLFGAAPSRIRVRLD